MKLLLSIALLFASTAQGVVDGNFVCRTADSTVVTKYEVNTIGIGEIELIHLSVTKIIKNGGETQTYFAKGLANQFVDSKGNETLVLEAVRVPVKNGQPVCSVK